VIPNNVLEKAAGFAIFTVVKAGFLVSARAGSGVVIARLPDGGEFLLKSEEGG
jgi:lipid-binding SYLF domain-containing protein